MDEHIHRQNCLEDYGVKVAEDRNWRRLTTQDYKTCECVWIVHAVLICCVFSYGTCVLV